MSRAAALGLAITVAGAIGLASTPADAKGCHDRTHVIGYAHCSRFGEWSSEQPIVRVWVDLGVATQAFLVQPFTLADGAPTASLAVHGAATSSGSHDLWVGAVSPIAPRFLLGIGDVLYAGLDLDGAALVHTPAPATGGPMFAAHAIGGAHALWGHVSLGGELAAGGRAVGLTAGTGAHATGVFEDRLELQARVTADVWISPHVSIGAGLGTSLVDRHDTTELLYVGGHVRAFDGMR